MREQLQSYIYTEKFLAQLYRRAAALASSQEEKNALLAFAQNAETNANYLNYFYKLEYGVNFDPMVPEINLQGGYRAVLNEILKLESVLILNIVNSHTIKVTMSLEKQ